MIHLYFSQRKSPKSGIPFSDKKKISSFTKNLTDTMKKVLTEQLTFIEKYQFQDKFYRNGRS
jgi:hypothetical protein